MIWYKQDRGLFDRAWTSDPKMVSVYLYLHCHAYVREKPLRGIMIRRGSCPTSKPAIAEATGLTLDEVKIRLNMLKNFGEIIIKPTNKGMIVTVCDYDGYNETDDLFSLNTPDGVTTQNTTQHPTQNTTQNPPTIYNIDNKKEEYNNLRSNFIPSKMERESSKALANEIKTQYNRTFAGRLIEWQRLSEKMIQKVAICVMRYGRQSVDMVFEQILQEPFSLGENKTGFQANFENIFCLDNFEKYLGRYRLRISRKEAPKPDEPQQPKTANGSWLDAISEDSNWRPK